MEGTGSGQEEGRWRGEEASGEGQKESVMMGGTSYGTFRGRQECKSK